MIEMTKQLETAWDECLMLWKALSETPDCDVSTANDFKNLKLQSLGLPESIYGCPFCQIYHHRLYCGYDCPLASWHDRHINHACTRLLHPYKLWMTQARRHHRHKQHKALKFYNYLLKKRTKYLAKATQEI